MNSQPGVASPSKYLPGMCPETSQASPSLPPPLFLPWRTCSAASSCSFIQKSQCWEQVWCELQDIPVPWEKCPPPAREQGSSWKAAGHLPFPDSWCELGVWMAPLPHCQAGKTTPGPALCGKSLLPLFPEPPGHLWTSGHLQSGKPICPRAGTWDPFVSAIKI